MPPPRSAPPPPRAKGTKPLLTRASVSWDAEGAPIESGPSIVAGRYTASGILSSRVASLRSIEVPRPLRLDTGLRSAAGSGHLEQDGPTGSDGNTGSASLGPARSPLARGSSAAVAPGAPSAGSPGAVDSAGAAGSPGAGDSGLQERDSAAARSAGPSRVGWRKAVDVLSQAQESDGSGAAAADGGFVMVSAQSLWRSITKSFTSRKHLTDSAPDSPREHQAAAAASTSGSNSNVVVSFRVSAAESRDVTASGGEGSKPSGGPGHDQPGPGSESAEERGRPSRAGEAADRAVREIDAKPAAAVATDAGGEGVTSVSGSEASPTLKASPSSRRLRFNQDNVLSSPSASAGNSRTSSRHNSFRDRVASALGFGGLGRSKTSEQSSPLRTNSSLRPKSALRAEGTSKQLKLGFVDESDSDEDDEDGDGGYRALTGGGYRSFKEEGATAASGSFRPKSALRGPAQLPASAPSQLKGPAALPADREGPAGIQRLDSTVVPARLHISSTQVPAELEDTLISPAALLPPGESLPSPFTRRANPAFSAIGHLLTSNPPAADAGRLPLPAMPSDTPELRSGTTVKFGGTSSVRFGKRASDDGGKSVAATDVASTVVAGVSRAVSAAPSMTSRAPPSLASAAAPPKARSTIKLPIITTGHWDSLVLATVWRVGRVFGFQAFNVRPSTQFDSKREYVPAGIFAAADHLIQLLVKNGYVRRNRGDDSDDERFGKALFEFHSVIFYSYEMQWTKMQRLSPRPQRFTDELRERVFSDQHITNGLLSELALYFLIYTEAANMRYCAEGMWWIFWVMNHSYVMAEIWNEGPPNRSPNARDRLPQLRNTFQHLIREIQMTIGIRPQEMRPEDCGKMSSILNRLSNTEVAVSDRELLADLISYGDGGFFMDRIITPIFYVMSYEIDHLATLGVDTAHRLGYDDFNESLTCRAVVYSTLMDLRVSPADIASGATNDAYQSLTTMGYWGAAYIDNKFDPQVAAEWWRNRVFVKTYRERRSWWGIYRAFYRIYAFHFVLFHVLQAVAFAGWNWRIVSSGMLTHAWLTWLERVANWMMTMHSPEPLQTTMTKIFDRRGFFKMDRVGAILAQKRKGAMDRRNWERLRKMLTHQYQNVGDFGHMKERFSIKELQAMHPERVIEIEGAPHLGLFGGLLEWLVIATLLTLIYTLQFAAGDFRQMARDYWGFISAGYVGAHALHFLVTTRDGYVISLTQALRLPEYFRNWSARPEPKTWMYNPMKTNWKNFSVNVFFWFLVLTMKVFFDFFVIHGPIVKPVRLLLTRNWLGCKGPVYRLPGGVTVPCISGDWILIGARIVPFIIVALFDTALFYQFVVTAFGIYHGLIKLDLGVISTWEDLVREFHKSPPRWWLRCMSFTGNENQKNLLFHTISANAQAAADNADASYANGEAGKQSAATVSDGNMFKQKFATPDDIRRKANLMAKERKVNMQAGKGGPSNEVEGKGISAVQRMGATAPGTAAPTRPGTTTATGTGTRTGAAAASGGKGDAKGGAASSAAAAGGGGGGSTHKTDTRPVGMHTVRSGRTLVGQDFKDAAAAPAGGIFGGWRGATGAGDATGGGSGLPGRFAARAPGDAQGAGVAGMFKVLGTVALAATRKGNQVQPEPVAEAVERDQERQIPSPYSPSSGRAAQPAVHSATSLGAADLRHRVRHPAWQPAELLGHDHGDYDRDLDPMASEPQPSAAGGQRSRRMWPWQRDSQDTREDGGAAMPMGPALGAMLAQGWRTRSEIQPADDEECGTSGASAALPGRPQEQEQAQRRGPSGGRVYVGPLGEGVTLLGADGKPLPDASDDDSDSARDSAPRQSRGVLLSEVPVMRLDSQFSDSTNTDARSARSGRVGFAVADDDDEDDDGPLPDKSIRFGGVRGGAPSRDSGDSPDDGYGRSSHELPPAPKAASHTRQRRASFLAALFKGGATEDDPDFGAGPSMRGGSSKASRSRFDLRERSFRSGNTDRSVRSGNTDRSVRGGDRSTRAGGMDRSVRGGDRSMRGSSMSHRRMSIGPQGGGFAGAIQRQKSITGGSSGLVARQRSSLGLGGVQRTKSINAASATSYEQKQFAKKWERQHSVAAQLVKKDLAARTTSMVLMGTDELQNLEEDELDVVSEQMMMWSSFAEAWDEICDDLREGDFVSDREVHLLKFVRLESSGKLAGLRPILLPTFFFAGQIRKVVDTGRVTTAQVMVLTEFRVLATWLGCQLGIMSGKHAHVIMTSSLYGGIVNVKHITLRKKSFDSAIKLIGLIEQAVRTREVPFDIQEFAEHFNIILHGLESECYAVQKMWELGRMYDDELDGALTLFEVVRDMQERLRNDPEDLKQCLKRAVAMEDHTTNTNVLLQVTTVLRNMLTTTSADATPQGEEAQRVLGFFINSLGHPSLDKPESLESMLSWSVLTPAYEEDVLYAVEAGLSAEELGLPKKKITDLLSETDDGFSLMAYLRAMFAFEWGNFKERIRRLVGTEVDIPDWGQVTELDFGQGGLLFEYRTELQLWASYRGQLLARTVRGMMCYERALKVLCRLEYPAPVGITDADYERWVDAMVASKFEYVIAVQTYGRNSKSKDLRLRQLAQGVDTLVQRFPTLKVVYLDDATDELRGPTQYSVLIRNRRASDPIVDPTQPFSKIVEAYRIRLPYNRYSNRGVVLGEGKPENQNQAMVFTINEGLQAIDMNQDNYLAEALKMRNLLSELHPSNKGQFMLFADDSPNQVLSPHMTAAELRFVILSRMKRSFPTALVGFREWIFSANTGALGQYAAATEYAFATIQSRIMTKPPRVRMHYGHPDVFNKTHILTRGGMSKGTRVLHISEDYFIGAAHTLRGARIRYKEYIACGKGRDMGFDSILSYQKKISGGAGDLATSREVHRLGTRLDFFRLMSFYHGGIGHFLNSYLTIMAAWYNIWALLLTAMAGAMELGIQGEEGQVTMTQTYNVQQVLQLGTLSIIPYVGQLVLETGLLRTLITVFGQIITGSLFFYIFQQQTVAASFGSVMAYGGMRYIGTGRGFSIQTTDFVKMYTLYARTHLYLGFEVLFFCATLYSLDDCTSCDYAALTWNSWLLAFVMIVCPLWFNPFIFNLSKVQRDYTSWKRWLSGDMDVGTGTNWYTWNREQLSKPRNDDGNVTDSWRNALREVVGTCVPYGLLVLAMVSRIEFRIDHVAVLENPYLEFLLATALLWTLALSISYLGHNLLERAKSKEWRIVRYLVTLTCFVVFLVYVAVLSRFYTGNGFKHLLQVAYANLVVLILVHKAATHMFTQNNAVRDFVDAGYYLIDVLVGFSTFAVLAVLAFVGFVNLLQSKLLFNEAFSQSVQTARIKMQVKRSGKQIKRKPKAGLLMTMDEWMRSRPASAASVAPSMAPTQYDGGVSRAVSLAPSAWNSLAPSMAPSMGPSMGPSMAPSAAASAFTSAAQSRAVSRRNSLTEMVNALVSRNQQNRGEAGPAGAGDDGVEVLPAGGGPSDGLATESGLRERRLRFL
ncbi:hypothetical protein GPECTOR_99g805 [Gonium pectorale]|uniref:1,3-beta-glucan synthase n=1 Tax=Gonium pectorale TaxID=33097 RepID=A0A150G1K2_GONPE|nr:hypothetical protein GPECTOR_99g805 [Gonium pectorale]|eukprot:KXZ43170.1 hypothetical protein GPECTOR_99g805 [Gonium pectorale]